MTRTPAPRTGRGRPAMYDTVAWDRYLAAVTAGMRLGEAAAHIGINPGTARHHARTNEAFAAALAAAKTTGKTVRDAAVPHGESRYTNHGCRCQVCTTAATAARTTRRAESDPRVGRVVELPAEGAGVASLSLARAS